MSRAMNRETKKNESSLQHLVTPNLSTALEDVEGRVLAGGSRDLEGVT